MVVGTVLPGSYTLMLDVLRLHSVTRSNHMGGCRYLMWRFMPTGKTTSIPSHYTLEASSQWTNTAIVQVTVPFQHGSNTGNTLTYYHPTNQAIISFTAIHSTPHLCQLDVAIFGWHGGHVSYGAHVSSELQTCKKKFPVDGWVVEGAQNMRWRITFRRIQYWMINNLYSTV